MKKVVILFCPAVLLLSSCMNTAEPAGMPPDISEAAAAPETSDTVFSTCPDGSAVFVEIRSGGVGNAEFSSVAETLNVDGKCYGKSYIFDDNKNEGTPPELTASGLTYEMLDSAELVGVGCIADGTVAYNDFRAEAPKYDNSEKCEVYRVNDDFMLCKKERTVAEERTPYDPPERYDGYEDGDIITTYYLFHYEESATEYARIGRILYEQWKFGGRELFRISDVVFTYNAGTHRRYFTVTVDGEEPLRELLEREGVDESLVEIVTEAF